jgi:hypothetical protein
MESTLRVAPPIAETDTQAAESQSPVYRALQILLGERNRKIIKIRATDWPDAPSEFRLKLTAVKLEPSAHGLGQIDVTIVEYAKSKPRGAIYVTIDHQGQWRYQRSSYPAGSIHPTPARKVIALLTNISATNETEKEPTEPKAATPTDTIVTFRKGYLERLVLRD